MRAVVSGVVGVAILLGVLALWQRSPTDTQAGLTFLRPSAEQLSGEGTRPVVATRRTSATDCSPCYVRLQQDGGKQDLQMDIWTPGGSLGSLRPIILGYGDGGSSSPEQIQCSDVFMAAGFVCVSAYPPNTEGDKTYYTEATIRYLVENAETYHMDADKIFLYGYSKGGHSNLYYMMWSARESDRARVKGLISDASAPGDKVFDWKKKQGGEYPRYPPYLMMHCWADTTMKPARTVEKSVKNIDKANKRRKGDDKIAYHVVKFPEETGCSHDPLVATEEGSQAAVAFVNNVASGAEPFEGLPRSIRGEGGTCSPCYVAVPQGGDKKELRMAIWAPGGVPESPRPIVLGMHGSGGDEDSLEGQCRDVFMEAGFVCVSATPHNTEGLPTYYTDATIKYLVENAATYHMDAENVFLYGYSEGGHSNLYYMMWSIPDSIRSRVRGVISDSSSPGDKKFDWAKQYDGEYLPYPPYLMLHCWGDETMEPSWSVEKSVKNIDSANKKRDTDEQIEYHVVKFTEETGCSHKSLLLTSEEGPEAAVAFVSNVLAGTAPFEGFPSEVSEPGSVKGGR